VIVDGRILRRAGKFTAFDHATIVAEAREAAIKVTHFNPATSHRAFNEVLSLVLRLAAARFHDDLPS